MTIKETDDTRKTVCYLIDDEILAIKRLTSILTLLEPDWIIRGFTTVKGVRTELSLTPPDVLFLDVEMPEMSGFELLEIIHSKGFRPAVVFVTGFEHYAIKAIRAKAIDYLLKPIDIVELKESLCRIRAHLEKPALADKIEILDRLTEAEKRVLMMLATGMTSKEIATRLDLSPNTINTQRNNILGKYQCNSLVELINMVERM